MGDGLRVGKKWGRSQQGYRGTWQVSFLLVNLGEALKPWSFTSAINASTVGNYRCDNRFIGTWSTCVHVGMQSTSLWTQSKCSPLVLRFLLLLPAAVGSFSLPLRPCFPFLVVAWLLLSLCLLWLLPGGSFLGWVGHPLHSHLHFSLEPSWNPFLRERGRVCVEHLKKCKTSIRLRGRTASFAYYCHWWEGGADHLPVHAQLVMHVGRRSLRARRCTWATAVAAGGPQNAVRTVPEWGPRPGCPSFLLLCFFFAPLSVSFPSVFV